MPPGNTIRVPPALTVVKLAEPPKVTTSSPPLLTVVLTVMPPKATALAAAIGDRCADGHAAAGNVLEAAASHRGGAGDALKEHGIGAAPESTTVKLVVPEA